LRVDPRNVSAGNYSLQVLEEFLEALGDRGCSPTIPQCESGQPLGNLAEALTSFVRTMAQLLISEGMVEERFEITREDWASDVSEFYFSTSWKELYFFEKIGIQDDMLYDKFV